MVTKVVFFGSTELSAKCLLKILDDCYFQVLAVVCQPDNPKAKKNKLFSPVKNVAITHNILCLQPLQVDNALETIKSLNASVGVCVAYGQFLSKAIRKLFLFGIINVHPSLLPKYRGGAPVQHAIWNNDEITGISIMKLNDQMDAGPYCFQKQISIAPNWTSGDLMQEVINQSPTILVKNLHQIINNQVTWTQQNECDKSFAPVLTKLQEKINWNTTSQKIVQHIKAFAPIPGTYTTYANNQIIKFFNAKIGSHQFNESPGTINLIDQNYICIQANDFHNCVHITSFLFPGKKPIEVHKYFGKYPFAIKDRFF